MVGPDRAAALCDARPFHSRDDVEKIAGFNKGMIDDLKSGGAELRS
jgi:DNA uptake protein ComE-like DNA-binding protein